MKKADAKTIGEIMADVLKAEHLDIKLDETRAVALWKPLMGEAVARYTLSVQYRNGVLYVQLASAVLRNELMNHRSRLIARFNTELGRDIITNIIFR